MKQFNMSDLNRDEKLTSVELDKFYKYKTYSRLDIDGNSCLSPKEFMNFEFNYSHHRAVKQ